MSQRQVTDIGLIQLVNSHLFTSHLSISTKRTSSNWVRPVHWIQV